MRHWLDSPPSAEHDRLVRSTAAALSEAASAPLLIKNLANTLRLERLFALFPNARLILIRRDLRMTAQSLLFVRRRLFGSDHRWWSIEPPGIEHVRCRDPLFQVLWQADTAEQIAIEACLRRPKQCAIIDYDGLCHRGDQVLSKLADRLALSPTGAEPFSEKVRASRSQRLSEAEWQHLDALYSQHFAQSELERAERSAPLRIDS
jgi:hypothetical protein